MPNQSMPKPPKVEVQEKTDVATTSLTLISAFCVGVLLGLAVLSVSFSYLTGGFREGIFRIASITGGINNEGVWVGVNIPFGGTKDCPRSGDDPNQSVVCRNISDLSCYSCCFSPITISGTSNNREECKSDGSCYGCDANHILCPDRRQGKAGQQVCCKVREGGFPRKWQGGCDESIVSKKNCVLADENGSYDGLTPTTTRTCFSS